MSKIEIGESFIKKPERIKEEAIKIIKNQKEYPLFNKAFLTPIEIILKDSEDRSKLPIGLQQVIKMNIADMKFTTADFKSFHQKLQEVEKKNKPFDLNYFRDYHCDNLLSLLKPGASSSGFQVAICVCMYSEDKSMLKRTLRGVFQNVKIMIDKGYPSHQIGVFVIMDGIQVVDPSVQQYFEQLQKEDFVFLTDDVDNLDLREIKQNIGQDEEQTSNISHILFENEQFMDRKNKRFSERKKEYLYNKNMIKEIEKMQKNKTITFEDLDQTMQNFFLEKAKEEYKKQYALTEQDFGKIENSQQILKKTYAQNIVTSLPIIRKALGEGKRYCQEYISSRDNLALMNCFRVPLTTIALSKKSSEAKKNVYMDLQEQDDREQSSTDPKANLFFVTKYKNRGKLSSHNWFFNGFCRELRPKYSILLDVGLVPSQTALQKMIYHMEANKHVGGVCGYMGLRIQRLSQEDQLKDDDIDCITALSMKFVDIQRAQQFEYHFAHLVDKPFQSAFGFIHVLPGAFSAYRMDAVWKNSDNRLLEEYFKSIDELAATKTYKCYPMSAFQTIWRVVLPEFLYYCFYERPKEDSYEKLLYDQNVYLAEDRTLCMGIHNNGYDLDYLPDASAWVDPIKNLHGLLGQRKRWINGSFFAFDKVKQTLSSRQSEGCLNIQISYLTIMNMMSFIAPGLFMYTIHIAMFTFQSNVILPIFQQAGIMSQYPGTEENTLAGIFVFTVDFIYVMMFLGLVFYSMHLTNRDSKFKAFFYGVSTAYGIFSISVFGVLMYDIINGFITGNGQFLVDNPAFVEQIPGGLPMINSLRYIMLGMIGLYAIPIITFFIYGTMKHAFDMLFSTFSFLFFGPTYLNILNIYALCRIDDISWGTKGLDSNTGDRKQQMNQEWKKIKIIHVCKFVFWNTIVAFLLLLFGDNYVVRFFLTFAIMILIALTLTLKVLIALIYLIKYRCSLKKEENKFVGNPFSTEEKISFNSDLVEAAFGKVKHSIYQEIIQSNGWGSNQKNQQARVQTNVLDSRIFKALGGFKKREKSTIQSSYMLQKSNIFKKSMLIQKQQNEIRMPIIKENTKPMIKEKSTFQKKENKVTESKTTPLRRIQETEEKLNDLMDDRENDSQLDLVAPTLKNNLPSPQKKKKPERRPNNLI